jgi:cyanophycinase
MTRVRRSARAVRVSAALILAGSLTAATVAAAAREPKAGEPVVGPADGTLFIVGGGNMTHLWPIFLELARGTDSAIVVIPTANETVDKTDAATAALRGLGATRLHQLHTRDRRVADSEEFVAPLREARAIWLCGGRQWRLADAYLNTRTLREIYALLARGGVVGGSSAGASIQASYMVRGSPEGNRVMMAPGHEEGFALLRGTAIDQHVNTRGRAEDLRPVLAKHRALLGIALDEATALIVRADLAEVVGAGHVRFFATPDAPPLDLHAGTRYDLAARRSLSVSAKDP